MNIELYKKIVEKHKFFILVIFQDVFVKWCFKQERKYREHIQLQFCTASMEHEKRSITKTINLLDAALRFVWMCTSASLSKAFEVSFISSPGLFFCIKAIECVFRLLITKEMNKNRLQSNNGKQIADDQVVGSKGDSPVNSFLPSRS